MQLAVGPNGSEYAVAEQFAGAYVERPTGVDVAEKIVGEHPSHVVVQGRRQSMATFTVVALSPSTILTAYTPGASRLMSAVVPSVDSTSLPAAS